MQEGEIAEQQENKDYFITHAVGQRVKVCFAPLTADDSDALNEDEWQGARFGEVWKAWAEHEIALKLTLRDSSDTSILGIVKVGGAQRENGKPDVLRNSLLEAAPAHRFQAEGRRYRGIGRVLVAQLVIESKTQGAGGRLLIRPVSDSTGFYEQIGFRPLSDNNYILEAQKPDELLKTCMLSANE